MLGKTAQAQGPGLSYIRFRSLSSDYLSGLPSEKGRYYTIALSRTFGIQPRTEHISATRKRYLSLVLTEVFILPSE